MHAILIWQNGGMPRYQTWVEYASTNTSAGIALDRDIVNIWDPVKRLGLPEKCWFLQKNYFSIMV